MVRLLPAKEAAMDDEISELSARVDALRLMLVLTIRRMDDPSDVLVSLMQLEHACRLQNSHAATIEEVVAVRDALDDL